VLVEIGDNGCTLDKLGIVDIFVLVVFVVVIPNNAVTNGINFPCVCKYNA